MMIRITMKDPDTLNDCIEDALKDLKIEGLSDDEIKQIKETRLDEIKSMAIRKWFKWGEYLSVDIDTEKEICIVVERKD